MTDDPGRDYETFCASQDANLPHREACPDCFALECECGPYVCPGCQSIAGEPCAPWCPDEALRQSRERGDENSEFDDEQESDWT